MVCRVKILSTGRISHFNHPASLPKLRGVSEVFFPKPQIPIWDDTYRYCISIRSFCFFRSRSRQTRVIALMAFEWWQSIPVVHQGSLIFNSDEKKGKLEMKSRKRRNFKRNPIMLSPIQLFNEEKIHEKVREPFVFNNERYSKRWP